MAADQKNIQEKKHGRMFSQSNLLSSANYRSTLMESKLIAISLFYAKSMEVIEHEDKQSVICSNIPVSVLKELLGYKRNSSFYKDIERAAIGLVGKTIGYSDPQSRRFHYSALIIDANYGDGMLTIKYNHMFKPYLMDIHANFTKFDLDMILGFESVYSYRIYEMLKAHYGRSKWENKSNMAIMTVSFTEMLFKLGLVKTENMAVKQMIMGKTNPDYEKAIAMIPKKKIKYGTWYDFSRYVLAPAIKEINEKTDISVHVDKDRKDIGGRVSNLYFSIRGRERIPQSENMSMEEIKKLIPFETEEHDLEQIGKAADGDREKIKKAVRVYYEQKNNIENPVAWLTMAIKDNYEPKRIQIEERDIDFSELEKLLLDN